MQKLNHPPPLWIPPQNMQKNTRIVTEGMPEDGKQAIENAPAFLLNDSSHKAPQSETENQKNNINIKIEAMASTSQVQNEHVNKNAETSATTMKSTTQVYVGRSEFYT